jgi:aminoglycoside 6'-N-acetyltransferase
MPASETALLVIDLQWAMFAGVGFGPLHDAEGLLERVRELIDRARKADVPVIYVQHNGPAGSMMEKGGAGWQYHREIAPLADDAVLEKTQSDSFLRTDLRAVLTTRGVERLVVVGAQTNACVDTTCRRAFSEGFEVVLVSDGHSTFDFGELTAEQIIRHHNNILAGEFATLQASADVTFD